MPPRPASPGRKSWKNAGTRPGQPPRSESKHIGRWVLSFLLLALIVAFAWAVWPSKWGQSHLIVMPIWSVDQLTLPPTPFGNEDIDVLRATPGVVLHDAAEVAQDEASLDGYLNKIAGLSKNEREVLMLYVSAHGLAEDGRPFIACSDFNRSTNGGKYDVNVLLEKVAKSRARLKLVILDAGRIDYDPRLGIVGNEFAARIADQMKKFEPQDLWVLLATGGSQVSAISYIDRRSVFGKAVAEALTGRANQRQHHGNDDSYLDLKEFAGYVNNACRNWFGEAIADYQTPILLKAGEGLAANTSRLNGENYRLVYLSRKQRQALNAPPPEEKPAEEKKGEEKKTDEKKVASTSNHRFILNGLSRTNTGEPVGVSPRTFGLSTSVPRVNLPKTVRGPMPDGVATQMSGTALAAGFSLENRCEEPVASAIPLKVSAIEMTPPGSPVLFGQNPTKTSETPPEKPPAESDAQEKKSEDPAAKKPDDPAAQPAATGDKPAAAQPAAPVNLKSPAPEATPAAPATPPAAKPVPAKEVTGKEDPQTAMQNRLRAEMLKLWELRDQLQSREMNGMSPVDFAPHVWRETEAWLVYFETRQRSGRSSRDVVDPSAQEALLLPDMKTLAGNLERLVTAMSQLTSANGVDDKSVGFRLIEAWNNRYLAQYKSEDEKFAREASAAKVDARQAVRQLHDLVYQAVNYVRWFGQANTTLPDAEVTGKPIQSHLESLGKQVEQLQQLERSAVAPSEQSRLAEFIAGVQQATEQQRRLDEMLRKFEAEALAKSREPFGQRRIEELLSTPVLPAARRIKLLETLQAISAPKPLDPSATGSAATQSSSASSSSGTGQGSGGSDFASRVPINWVRVRKCLELEERLIRVVDVRAATTLERDIRETENRSQQAAGGEGFSAEFWDNYHRAIQSIKAFYTRIPRETDSPFTLQLVDARDAMLVDAKQYPLARFRIELESSAELQLEPLAQTLRLDDQFEAKLGVTLVTNKQNLLDSRVSPTNADGILAFELLPEVKELPTERGLYRKTMFWRVTARKESIRDGKTATLARFAVNFGASPVSTSVEVNLPQPNRVDLFFDRIAVPTQSGGQSSTIGLQLFPNRTTRFICSLANQYDQAKTVEVYIYAIPPRPLSRTPIGKLDDILRSSIYDDAARVYLNPKLVAKSAKPIELPAATPGRGTPVRIPVDLIGPQAAAPPPPAVDAKPTTPPPQTPVPEPIHGLAVRIVDVKQPGNEPPKWIELSPLSPHEYLTAEIGYDQRLQQIVAKFTPKIFDSRGRANLPIGKPIEFKWDPTGADLPEQGKQQLNAVLDPSSDQPTAILRAEAPPDNQEREVRISVDGYPRAFFYLVRCRRIGDVPEFIKGEDLARTRTDIRIASLTVADQEYVYHFPPHIRLPAAEPKKKADNEPPLQVHINLQNHQPALFRAPAGTLTVHLEADAPIDAFTNATDAIRIRLRENDETRNLRATRDLGAFFVGCGQGGLIELDTRVSDLAVPLEVGSLQNVKTAVDAEIQFRTTPRVSQAVVQFDGVRPFIQNMTFPRTVAKDAKATASFEVDDFTGVQRVVWGFSKDGSESLVDATAVARDVTARLNDDRRHVFSVEIDTKDVPPGPQRLVARVIDPVGHASELKSVRFVIVEAKPAGPMKGEIRGVITFGRSSVQGALFELTIEGGSIGTKPVPLNPDGSFVVPDLEPGDYVLKPKGSVSGKNVKEKEFKAKPTDPKKREVMTLDVSG